MPGKQSSGSPEPSNFVEVMARLDSIEQEIDLLTSGSTGGRVVTLETLIDTGEAPPGTGSLCQVCANLDRVLLVPRDGSSEPPDWERRCSVPSIAHNITGDPRGLWQRVQACNRFRRVRPEPVGVADAGGN